MGIYGSMGGDYRNVNECSGCIREETPLDIEANDAGAGTRERNKANHRIGKKTQFDFREWDSFVESME